MKCVKVSVKKVKVKKFCAYISFPTTNRNWRPNGGSDQIMLENRPPFFSKKNGGLLSSTF